VCSKLLFFSANFTPFPAADAVYLSQCASFCVQTALMREPFFFFLGFRLVWFSRLPHLKLTMALFYFAPAKSLTSVLGLCHSLSYHCNLKRYRLPVRVFSGLSFELGA
jgi:hypothetical protein